MSSSIHKLACNCVQFYVQNLHFWTQPETMEITIKAAAEMVGVSRSTLYQYMKDGKLSRCASGKLETSEVLRVFGDTVNRRTPNEQSEHITELNSTLNTEKENLYKERISTLESELRQAREREQQHLERENWQRQQIDKLTDTLKLLEAPTQPGRTGIKGVFKRLWGD